jgi:hypothetical protein
MFKDNGMVNLVFGICFMEIAKGRWKSISLKLPIEEKIWKSSFQGSEVRRKALCHSR